MDSRNEDLPQDEEETEDEEVNEMIGYYPDRNSDDLKMRMQESRMKYRNHLMDAPEEEEEDVEIYFSDITTIMALEEMIDVKLDGVTYTAPLHEIMDQFQEFRDKTVTLLTTCDNGHVCVYLE